VDKNLKHHGLIQAFSRTNRTLHATGTEPTNKPFGNILDFRQQQTEVDAAIALFSGEKSEQAKEIWMVEPAPKVIEQYEKAVAAMEKFMAAKDLACEPQEVYNLKGDTARIEFINRFKEVQRLKTQLDQYTDLDAVQKEKIEAILPEDQLRAFRGSYLETAKQLKEIQRKEGGHAPPEVQQLDFEFVLFASALIDYDYIMGLIARSQGKPSKEKMTRQQIIDMLSSSANLMDERDDMVDYIRQLDFSKGLPEQQIRDGYQTFKTEKNIQALNQIAQKHGLEPAALQAFADGILHRMIFDGEQLSDLLAPLELGWKARTQKELSLMEDLVPFLNKLAQGREISGLSAYA
jgi:type I restriction enzyme R subunit